MTVEPLLPDVPAPFARDAEPDASAFARALDALGGVLDAAQQREDAFASGSGSLHDAMYARARADVALTVAAAAAQRTASALQTIANMQL